MEEVKSQAQMLHGEAVREVQVERGQFLPAAKVQFFDRTQLLAEACRSLL